MYLTGFPSEEFPPRKFLAASRNLPIAGPDSHEYKEGMSNRQNWEAFVFKSWRFSTIFLIILLSAQVTHVFADNLIPADRRITWNPGIPGGIPNRTTIFANVKNAPYNAVGDGVHDDTVAIQQAITACPTGQVVYIPPGTYRTSGSLNIGRFKTVRGAGPSQTKIIDYGTSDIFNMVSGSISWSATDISSGYTKDSTTLTLASSTLATVGCYLCIDQLNKGGIVDMGDCNWCFRQNGANRNMSQIVKVTAVNGNTVTISPPLYYTFEAAYAPQAARIQSDLNSMVQYSGVEDLYVERRTTGTASTFMLNYAVNCWVKNVESYNAQGYHVRLQRSYGCVVRDSYFHHGNSGYSAATADHGYGLILMCQNSDNLIENNIFYYLRHSMVFSGGGSGNVLGYNYSYRMFDDYYPNTDWLMGDLLTHGSHPYMNLFEGNVVDLLFFDGVHGSSSHNTAFRNYATARSLGEATTVKYALRGACADFTNRYENVIGCVLTSPGVSGAYDPSNISGWGTQTYVWLLGYKPQGGYGTATPSDPLVASTLLRHGNYDYITKSTHWDPSITNQTLPASLYLPSKPGWWDSTPWPPIGPDVSGYTNAIPAYKRFTGTSVSKPNAPTNLRIVP